MSWVPPERVSDSAFTLTKPPMPSLVVSAVTLALLEMMISVPKSEILPPSPDELLVWAVILPAPEMVSDLSAVPILMSPPLPFSPMPLLVVWALILEELPSVSIPEKEMVRSRGLKGLMLISLGLGLLR